MGHDTTRFGTPRAALAGLGVAGGGFLIAKGVIRASTGDDLSFVPISTFLMGFGLLALAGTVTETRRFPRSVTAGGALGVVAIGSGFVALAYVLTGTIPESDGAPALVGVSYGVGAAAAYLAQLVLGVTAARSRALAGRLRWAPLGVVVLQFPVFILAGAIGDTIGDETVTDGLGMALTGALWAGSSTAVWVTTTRSAPKIAAVGSRASARI